MSKDAPNPFAQPAPATVAATAPESAPVAPVAAAPTAPAATVAPPAPPPPAGPPATVEPTGLIRMVRSAEDAKGGPTEADVHPDMVAEYTSGGFRIKKD